MVKSGVSQIRAVSVVECTLKTKAGDSYKRRQQYTTLRGFIFHKAPVLLFISREIFPYKDN